MSEISIQILSGVGLFFLGVLIGAVFHRSFQGEASKNKRLEQKLAELQDTYTKYQAEVSAHFMETAKKVQTLNNSYRDVHAQLAKGASRLCNDDEVDDFLAISFDSNEKAKAPSLQEQDGTYSPPMDYAPKENPDAEGTLSEKFGLSDTAKDEDEEAASPEAIDESTPTTARP